MVGPREVSVLYENLLNNFSGRHVCDQETMVCETEKRRSLPRVEGWSHNEQGFCGLHFLTHKTAIMMPDPQLQRQMVKVKWNNVWRGVLRSRGLLWQATGKEPADWGGRWGGWGWGGPRGIRGSLGLGTRARISAASLPSALLSDFKPTSALLLEMLWYFRNGSLKEAAFEKGRFPEFATGYYFYDTVLLSSFKIYIIFILPLLSIYFYFIAYHVGDIWLLNVWRIGPVVVFFFLFFCKCLLWCINLYNRSETETHEHSHSHTHTHTHAHTLITLPFYLTLRVCGYIYKSRQIWNRWSELIQVGSDEASSLLGVGWGREGGREPFVFCLWRTHQQEARMEPLWVWAERDPGDTFICL